MSLVQTLSLFACLLFIGLSSPILAEEASQNETVRGTPNAPDAHNSSAHAGGPDTKQAGTLVSNPNTFGDGSTSCKMCGTGAAAQGGVGLNDNTNPPQEGGEDGRGQGGTQ